VKFSILTIEKEKCSILKKLILSNKTGIPGLALCLGLPLQE